MTSNRQASHDQLSTRFSERESPGWRPPDWPLVEDLTQRECEILAGFAEGKSDREIAEKLILSLSTVKWYARQIYGKLGVDNRRMAVARGQELGLLGRVPALVPRLELPAFLTPFVGREQEIRELCHFMASGDHRLVTLVGSGGIGKTWLAVQVVHTLAEQQLHSFTDGFCFVSLAGISAPAAMVTALGAALRINFSQSSSPQRQLHEALSAKRMLLVLDNMEHLLGDQEFDATKFLLDLLHAAPHLKVIVTSRFGLGVQSEQLYPLGGLAYPDPATEPVQDAGNFGAVQLFLQHIQRVEPGYQRQPSDSRSIVQICHLLDGMPLAIVLAATWIRVMSCSEMVAELTRNLDFLSTTLHDLPPRHRSLRAVFERSWQLLSGTEQDHLSQLSVFRGGFSREAAQAVAGLSLAMISRVVDHSLVQRQSDGRFAVHELLRHFLGEKLHANPTQWEQAHRQHGEYYGARFARQGWFLDMAEEESPGAELLQGAAEIENVKSAWVWAVQHQVAPTIRQLMNPLTDYFFKVGIWEEGGRIFDEAVAAIRSADRLAQEEKDSLAASLLLRRSLLMGHSQHTEALKVLNESLSLLRQSDPEDPWEIALALVQRGVRLTRLGQNAEGVESIEAGRALLEKQNHLPGVGYALSLQGSAENGWGRLGRAAESLERATRLLEGVSRYQYWAAIHFLGNAYMLQGRYQQAEVHLDNVISHYVKHHPRFALLAFALRNRGDLAIAMGDLEQAEFYLSEATAHFERMGVTWNMAIPLAANRGVIARLQGKWEEAERLLTEDLSTARRVGSQQRVANNLHNLARLRHDQGRYQDEKALLDEALQIARQGDFRFATARVLCQLGHTALALHQPEAKRHYAEALRIATAEEIDRITLETLTGVAGQIMQEHNDDFDDNFAVALLTLVQEHPGSEFETKRKAHHLLVELEARLTQDQFAQGRQQSQHATLQAVVSGLLRDYLAI